MVKRSCHISSTYRCFKSLNDETFLADLSEDFSRYSVSESDIETLDLTAWYDILLNRLNQHAPIKTKRVKPKRMPPWYNPAIAQASRYRDMNKKNYETGPNIENIDINKISNKKSKEKPFTASVPDKKELWQHIKSVQIVRTRPRNYYWTS